MSDLNTFYTITNTTSDFHYLKKICVNPIDLFIIWSERSVKRYDSRDKLGYIYRTRYDGSNKISLVNVIDISTEYMAIDFIIKRIYWFDIDINGLYSIDYNGKDKKRFIHRILNYI